MKTTQQTPKGSKVGAALVIGGGIAGIQAALDLADSGQKVYLLERAPSIGGNMARLDKTFPTNDCSMCILSPKVVECGRHLNIETIAWAELEGVTGTVGNFTARIRRRARYVDSEKCTGCGECATVCPVQMPSEFDAQLGTRKAIFRPCPQAYPNTFVIDKRGRAPCRVGCPAGININGYVALTAMGKFDEALDLILDTVPLPGVLGRVCDHPCESVCHLGTLDAEPVAICAIKRFLADRRRLGGQRRMPQPSQPKEKRQKVAIIGAGPAGLTAARELARKGYQPTIFEAESQPGGMLSWGIPAYRLPREVLHHEIEDILAEGVELQLNCRFGSDITRDELTRRGYKALILAIGAQAGAPLGIENENLEGVYDSIRFLRQVNAGRPVAVGRRVTVIGGGNSAIDAARTALRLGAEQVTIVYRRTRTEMPAIPLEIKAAEEEGVRLELLAAPVRLHGIEGRVSRLECIRMRPGAPDASGRRAPVPVPRSEFFIETDTVISAIGQKVVMPDDPEFQKLQRRHGGTIQARPETCATDIPGVFAIGDAVTGPRSVIEAIAEGRKAAHAVDCYLRGVPFEPLPRVTRDQIVDHPPRADQSERPAPRRSAPELPVEERRRGFTEVEATLSEEDAVAEAQRCLRCAVCSECLACVRFCKAQAIRHDQEDVIEEINVGSIVVVPGFEEYHSTLKYDFGYSRFPDVVSSLEFERILSASGPFGGHVQRPSDGREPGRIAFLQCVGSRDLACRNDYCSSVCCMYAIKEAVIAKEHSRGLDVTIFFMDMRAFGKDFDKYYERARSEYGVRFVRARVSDVRQQNGQLILRYAPDTGGTCEEPFDMVVLSVGLQPPTGVRELASKLGVRTDKHGFMLTDPLNPLHTSRPGIFVGGPASAPKDIPETVVQASGAAAEVARLLSEVRNTLTVKAQFPPERDVSSVPPRIGVFVCHCGINIGGVVNVPAVAEYALTLPHVVHAEHNLYTCSQDTQDHIRAVILEKNINRVVVASCSPRTHEPLFQQTLRQAGLNPHLFVMANIRDQCSWAHLHEPEAATQKARDLVRMAAAKAALTVPLRSSTVPVIRQALVIGGGTAGMTAALAIADQGYHVCLVERDARLGGNLRDLPTGFEDQDLRAMLKNLIAKVKAHANIRVLTETTVVEVQGFVGNFTSKLSNGEEYRHGVAIIATGASEYQPREYLYGEDRRIITQRQLSQQLAAGNFPGLPPACVVMIQCVGSRTAEHPYCSRVCCTRAVKNAAQIKEHHPETEVIILYRDMRTYGFQERHYQRARELGVLFIRFDADRPPILTGGPRLDLSVFEPLLQTELHFHPDLVVLSTGIVSSAEDNDRLAKLFKVPLNDDGFFLEAHAKLRPVEFATEGVYLAGLAHGPKNLSECIAQALAAAARAGTVLAKDEIETSATIAEVLPDRCVACGLCTQICAYNAISLELQRIGKEERVFAKVNPALCKGCGACVAGCRSGALNLAGFSDKQILAEIAQL